MNKAKLCIAGLLCVIVELLVLILIMGNKKPVPVSQPVQKESTVEVSKEESAEEKDKEPSEEPTVDEQKETTDIDESLFMKHRGADELSFNYRVKRRDKAILEEGTKLINDKDFMELLKPYEFITKYGIEMVGYYEYGGELRYRYVINNTDATFDIYAERELSDQTIELENVCKVDSNFVYEPVIMFENGLPSWSRELGYSLYTLGWKDVYTTDWKPGDDLINIKDADGNTLLNGEGTFLGTLISEESCNKYGIEYRGGLGD